MKLHVEGGGDTEKQHTLVRKAFQKFFENANIPRKPSVVACGGRQQAWDRYQAARARKEDAALLIDSEHPFAAQSVRDFLSFQGFGVKDHHQESELHLMVRCMEAWLLADREALVAYFGQGFQANALPSIQNLAGRAPADLERDLKHASRNTTKGEYNKGQHSWVLLARLDPGKLSQAQSFLDWLRAL